MRPLAIDLFCGLGGWTEGLLAEGYDVVGFDIKRHKYGEHCYPGTTWSFRTFGRFMVHSSKMPRLSSPRLPVRNTVTRAMPWGRAKAKAALIRADTTGKELERLNRLFDTCFRIQREACIGRWSAYPD